MLGLMGRYQFVYRRESRSRVLCDLVSRIIDITLGCTPSRRLLAGSSSLEIRTLVFLVSRASLCPSRLWHVLWTIWRRSGER